MLRHHPAALLLEKDSFENWCNKIDTLRSLVSPSRQVWKDNPHAFALGQPIYTPSGTASPNSLDSRAEKLFQTSKIGGNKLW